MAPKAQAHVYRSSLDIKDMQNKKIVFKTADLWLEDKKNLDGAEGIWRVHNDLYDLTDFVKKHPGGQFWLNVTKGTDITEAFESHHISTLPQDIIKKYFVRNAKIPRNTPFTFENNGFYRTLKRNVREALNTIPKGGDIKSKIIIDCLLIGAFGFGVLANSVWSYTFGIIAGILLSSAAAAAHNYYHRRDNFRMYYSDVAMVQSREWRIVHILSHHLYTNTIADMQIYFTESMLYYVPHSKSLLAKYASWIYAQLVLWPIFLHLLFFRRMFQWIFLGHNKHVSKLDLLPLLLPFTMYVCCGQSLLLTIGMWTFIIVLHSYWFCFIGTLTGHSHPEIDGDKPRSKDEMDWGINQLDTVLDGYDVTGSHFLVLLTFGDHALHHLFPTFDHGILHHLYPVVQETMKQFNIGIRMTTHAGMFGGYLKKIAREKPNSNLQSFPRNK